METFFLVRSPNCYKSKPMEVGQGKHDTIESAQGTAMNLAEQYNQTQYVYEVKLVGKASVSKANWIPET